MTAQGRTLKDLIDRLENYYEFACEGGPLKQCVEWQQLTTLLASSSQTVEEKELGNDLAVVMRAIRPLDCGALHCRYCPAGANNQWQHTEHCIYEQSVKDVEQARSIIAALRVELARTADGQRAVRAAPLASSSGLQEEEKDHGAGLIGQTIPDVAETEPRLNMAVGIIRQMLTLLTNTSGFDQGATPMWHSVRRDAVCRADAFLGQVGNAPVSANSGIAGTMSSALEHASSSGQGWQPIETAPKDDNEYLFCFADGDIEIGFWSEAAQNWDSCSVGGWFGERPTHWMPLPAPPVGSHGNQVVSEASGSAQSEAQ